MLYNRQIPTFSRAYQLLYAYNSQQCFGQKDIIFKVQLILASQDSYVYQ